MQQGAGGRLDGRFHHHTALSRPSWLLMLLTAVCACDGGAWSVRAAVTADLNVDEGQVMQVSVSDSQVNINY